MSTHQRERAHANTDEHPHTAHSTVRGRATTKLGSEPKTELETESRTELARRDATKRRQRRSDGRQMAEHADAEVSVSGEPELRTELT